VAADSARGFSHSPPPGVSLPSVTLRSAQSCRFHYRAAYRARASGRTHSAQTRLSRSLLINARQFKSSPYHAPGSSLLAAVRLVTRPFRPIYRSFRKTVLLLRLRRESHPWQNSAFRHDPPTTAPLGPTKAPDHEPVFDSRIAHRSEPSGEASPKDSLRRSPKDIVTLRRDPRIQPSSFLSLAEVSTPRSHPVPTPFPPRSPLVLAPATPSDHRRPP
jgi:hypothetical protein